MFAKQKAHLFCAAKWLFEQRNKQLVNQCGNLKCLRPAFTHAFNFLTSLLSALEIVN